MTSSKHSLSVSDVPILSREDDMFGVANYVDSLCDFISQANTPLTIAIQGEWGAGKTSFMRMIESRLCDKKLPDSKRFDSIWLETWNLFLETSQDTAAKKLFVSIISQLSVYLRKLKGSKVSVRKENVSQTLKTITAVALNMLNIETESVDRLWRTMGFDQSGETAYIADIKRKLEELIDAEVKAKGNGVTDKGFIVFVDDLDRLDPKLAIVLLETMKNLFDIKNCIFVLAIDFDVVKLGTEQKYGTDIINGRNVAQDFFDKIIQLSFNVPVSQYDIMPLVDSRLRSIEFLRSDYEYAEAATTIREIFLLSTNKNPRSIKAILNSLQITVDMESNATYLSSYRLMMLLIVALHKAFPTTYALLANGDRRPVDDWEPMLTGLFDNSASGNLKRRRVEGLLNIYTKLYNDCTKTGIPIGQLFEAVDILNGRDQTEMRVFYDGARYDLNSKTQQRQGVKLIEDIDFSNHYKVLDVGCGNGRTTIEMWDCNRNMNVLGIDISKGQIKKAIENYQSHISEIADPSSFSGSIKFEVKDAEEPYGRARYDLIFSNSALHWSRRPKLTYAYLYQALKTDGLLAVHQGGDGTYRGLHANARRAIENLGLEDRYPKDWTFPAFYPTAQAMTEMLESIGFVNVRVESVASEDSNPLELTNAFAVASLIFYQTESMTDDEYAELEREFKRLCSEYVETYTNRIYVYATKPKAKKAARVAPLDNAREDKRSKLKNG